MKRLIKLFYKGRCSKKKDMERTTENKELQNKLYKLTGFIPSEMEDILSTKAGEDTLEHLTSWAELTKKSLDANRAVLVSCLVDSRDGHLMCRFCAEGIPSWKAEGAREHLSDCPVTLIIDLLDSVKSMRASIFETGENKISNN